MDCPACGSDNRDGARFCRSCGTELAGSLLPEPVDEALPESATAEEVAEAAPAPSEQDAGSVVEAADSPGEDGADRDESEAQAGRSPEKEVGEDLSEEAANAAGEDAEEAALGEEAPSQVEAEESVAAGIAPEDAAAEGTPAGDDSPEIEADGPEPAEPEEEAAPEGAEDNDFVEAGDEDYGFWRDDTEPLEPLPESALIADRYVVAKVLEHDDREIRYLAHDLGRCWQCAFEDNTSDDEFCAKCGAMLDHWPEVTLVEVQTGRAMPASGEPVLARMMHVGRHLLVLGEPQLQPDYANSLTPPTIRLVVGQHSDKGQVRELDEDSLFSLVLSPTYESRTGPVLGLFAVADGMGGYEGGEVASRLAIQTLADRVMRLVILPELAGEMILEDEVVVRLRQATIAANDDVFLTRQKGGNEMGTTLTVAFIRDDLLFLSHVGDCRAYRWSANGLEQLTTDHSVVASLIAEGRAQPEEIYTHPHRSVVYRCIGDKPLVEVDTDVMPLSVDDRLIICCDGLWEMVRDEGIADVMMQEADPQLASELLVRRANAAGGEDNISVIVVQVEAL